MAGSAAPYTRSSTRPLNKDMCFFCHTDNEQKLFSIRTGNAGQSLKQAVQASSDPELKTRYSTCIADGDVHAMDIQYHKACWTKYVLHVLRDDTNQAPKTKQSPTQISSIVELLNIIDTQTRDGAYLSIQDIENTYVSMLHFGGTESLEDHSPAFTRQWLKDRILSELPHVKSVRQINMRSPAVLYCPEACDADMLQSAIRTADDTESMTNIYQSARLLRQRIEQFTKNVKTSSSIVVISTLEDVPVELYTMIRWIMAGPANKLQTEVRTTIVDRGALTLSQNLMFGFKSKRQVTYKPSDEGAGFRSQQARENPQVLGLAPTIHHDIKNKKLVNLLNAQGHCASYSRALIMETAIGNAVVENTKQFQGLYVPPLLKKCSLPQTTHTLLRTLLMARDTWDSHCHLPEGWCTW